MNDSQEPIRCNWAGFTDPVYIDYHDTEWGVPVTDDRHLFEMLILEGAQAGLSWITILKRRDTYRKAYDDFNPGKVASYDDKKKAELLADPGIIRNRRKVDASVRNAQVFLDMQKEFGSFAAWLWNHVDGKPVQGNFKTLSDMPVTSDLSDRISAELKKRGMSFVGSTIMYAYLQAVGVYNNHVTGCFRFSACAALYPRV